MGGQLAEIYRDTSVRCARWTKPKRWDDSEVKGLALVRGYRGLRAAMSRARARARRAVALALVQAARDRSGDQSVMVRADACLRWMTGHTQGGT